MKTKGSTGNTVYPKQHRKEPLMETATPRNADSSQNPFGQTFGGSDIPPPKRSLPPDALRLYHGLQRFMNPPSASGPTLASFKTATGSFGSGKRNLSPEPARQASPGLSSKIGPHTFSDKTTPAVSNSATSSAIRRAETSSPPASSFGRDNAAFKPVSAASDTSSVTDPRTADAILYGSDTSSGNSSRFRSQDNASDYALAAGNEGFHMPAEIHPGLIASGSPQQQERTRQESVRLQHSLGNEGFTLSPDTPEQAARFKEALEAGGKQAGAMLSGQERETRLAYGMPAEGESTQSAWGTYMNAKRKSDTATHDDEARYLNRLAGSGYGTGITDLSHSLIAGGYDAGSKALTYGYLVTKPLTFMWDNDVYTDPQSGITYKDDLSAYLGYPARRLLHEKKEAEKAARSEAYQNASLTQPGYLPVKAVGTVMEDLITTLVMLYLTRQAGLGSATAVSMAISAVSDYSSGYDRTVAEWMDKPQGEIGQNRVYRELRRQGITDTRARFIIGHTLGEKQAKRSALAGALRAYAASRVAGMTRTGEEGAGTLIWQDTLINMGFDGVSNYLKKEEKSKK